MKIKTILPWIVALTVLCLLTGCAGWHSVTMTPKPREKPITLANKINPIWWFGNADEPIAPSWYRPGKPLRNVQWYMRNPFANFANYVIGVADRPSVRMGKYPTKIGNPSGKGWNFAVTKYKAFGVIPLHLPFVDYKCNLKYNRIELYFGWRERGNFGIKVNFNQRPPHPKKKPKLPDETNPV